MSAHFSLLFSGRLNPRPAPAPTPVSVPAPQGQGAGGWSGAGGGAPRPPAGSGRPAPGEYGGGPLGTGGAGVTQPPNFIRLIANTIREVGGAGADGRPGGGGVNMGNILKNIDPGQFASLFQQL